MGFSESGILWDLILLNIYCRYLRLQHVVYRWHLSNSGQMKQFVQEEWVKLLDHMCKCFIKKDYKVFIGTMLLQKVVKHATLMYIIFCMLVYLQCFVKWRVKGQSLIGIKHGVKSDEWQLFLSVWLIFPRKRIILFHENYYLAATVTLNTLHYL